MEKQIAKVLTQEEILKVAPNYRGKPENFNPDFKKTPKQKAKPKDQPPKRRVGPKSPTLPPPKHVEENDAKPTPQKNDPMWSDDIYGVDMALAEIKPRQTFDANLSKIICISDETYECMRIDDPLLDRKIEKLELRYYHVALLWIRLLDIKRKRVTNVLTSDERAVLKVTEDVSFNVLKPVSSYLTAIGSVVDGMGKTTELDIPSLPVAKVDGMGGYHASAIDEGTHNLFEEVPCLGVVADALMSLATEAPQAPKFKIGVPEGAKLAKGLAGWAEQQSSPRLEIIRRLSGEGITTEAFPEYIAGTRFNMHYVESISDILATTTTFKVDKMVIPAMTRIGAEAMIIKTVPKIITEDAMWYDLSVEAQSSAMSSTAQMGLAIMSGFQLSKGSSQGTTNLEKAISWTSVTAAEDTEAVPAWAMPDSWYASANARRELPPGINTVRFRSLIERQDTVLENIVRRMIQTQR